MNNPMLRMMAAIYLEMKDGETQSEAENRMIELLDEQGVKLVGWRESEIITWEDEDGD